MVTQLQKSFYILLVLLLLTSTLTTYSSQAAPDDSSQGLAAQPAHQSQAGMPDELKSAFLAATSHPFEPSAGGYCAHSGGLDFTLDAGGLQASGGGFTWSLTLDGFGREGRIKAVSDPEIGLSNGRLEFHRGPLIEWYRNTPLGVEQGFTIQASRPGEGPLVLLFNLPTADEGLDVTMDADGGGLSFTNPNGQALRYDHLRAWDVDGASLDAHLSYAAGEVVLKVNDQDAAYPITVDPLIHLEEKASESGATGDEFGYAVSLSGDTALVGVHYDDVGTNPDQGSAYIFTRSGSTWTQQAQLIAMNGAQGDEFGHAVALSGDTALVGSPKDDAMSWDQGLAYVFTRSGTTWTQQAQLTAADGSQSDRFGYSVALSGDTALVGASDDDVGGHYHQGSAYVFTRSGLTWTQQAKLYTSDGAVEDHFGRSVALSGNSAIVGGPSEATIFTRSGTIWTQQVQLTGSGNFGDAVALSGDTALVAAPYDDVGGNSHQGSAYVFTRSGTIWTLQAQLTALDGAVSDFFGKSVALSGDTALVGSDAHTVGSNYEQGSAYVFTRIGTTWTQQSQLTAADGARADCFGISVALSGDTALVGANLDDVGANPDQGSAYVFTRSGTIWTQQAQLAIADGAWGERFGFSVALEGDTALVGAYNTTVGSNTSQGSVYVYVRNGTAWMQQAQLTAEDGAAEDNFGIAVALLGDTALVGANNDDVGTNTNQGSAYVFTRSGTTWTQQAQLTAADGASYDHFGRSLALSGDTALVGAPDDRVDNNVNQGSTYVFTRSGTVWTQQTQLIAADGATADNFGISVALSGDTALVGAPYTYLNMGFSYGSAYVFTRSGTVWTEQAQLASVDSEGGDRFGYAVSLLGDTALVGARSDDIGVNTDQGSAYIYVRSGVTWTQQAKLTAADGAASDNFGASVSLSSDTALVGAPYDHVELNSDQGSAYVFLRSGTEWSQQAKLTANDGTANDRFGFSVALTGDTALVGAYLDDVSLIIDQGSATVFVRGGTVWTKQAQLISDISVFDNNIYLPIVVR